MPTLKPAFDKSGTITAANASKVNDGAAAPILASGETVKKKGLTPLAKVVGWGHHAGRAPRRPSARDHGCNRAGISPKDIDLYEINEAFAVVAVVSEKNGLTRA